MINIIEVFVWFNFPPALLLLAILVLPLPLFIRKLVIRLADSLLFFRFHLGSMLVKVIHFVIGFNMLVFIWMTMSSHTASKNYEMSKTGGHGTHNSLMMKFRADRQWWISFMAVTVWFTVHRLRHEVKRANKAEEALRALKAQ